MTRAVAASAVRAARRLATAAVLALAAVAQNPVAPPPKVAMAFNRFYDYDETVAALNTLAAAHPDVLTLSSIGRSFEGREMWLATLAIRDGVALEARPAMWIDANVHGNEIQGTEVCLYTLWYLTERRGTSERVDRLLREKTLYVLPMVNPDGRHWWFHAPNTMHSSRTGKRPVDDDRDGVADEDGPNDLDGDGSITQMRKRVDRGGTHVLDPEDPRLLRAAKPGQEGTHVLLGGEGIDDDGDGRIDEDGPGGYDLNRNWPTDWRPNHQQFGAGDYPLSHPEARCIADFLLAHPNVAAVQSYHNAGGMILRGPGQKAYGEYPPEDVAVYDEMGRAGEEMLPHYRYMILWRDLYPVYGGFVTWCFEGLGVFSFTNELWTTPQYGGAAADDLGRLRFDDRVELGERYAPWKPYRHPQFGDVEIGGWRKDTGRVPPRFMLEELCHRNMAFTVMHAERMPNLEADAPTLEKLGDGLYAVTAEVRNTGAIPTRSATARQKGIGTPDRWTLSVLGGAVVAGGRVIGPHGRERTEFVEKRPERLLLDGGVPGRGRVRARWLVRADGGAPKATMRYEAEKGGVLER
ncbi:MAG TPA: M14 family metallopeptidase [Planctomycetota bacterium]|nr:M14 family metallopeptidase [Planctomycetota bacterium]